MHTSTRQPVYTSPQLRIYEPCLEVPSEADILAHFQEQTTLQHWNEDTTPFDRYLFLDAATYQPAPIFDLSHAQKKHQDENYVVSPNGSFAYQNRLLTAGFPLFHQGQRKGMAVFNGDVVLPMLIDMKVHWHTGERFAPLMGESYRVKYGAVWMSLTPSEMLTQRPGVEKAQDTVVIGGLGLGWLLRKACEKESVNKVIVVERSRELLDWYGYDLCKRHPKVTDVICDDVYSQLGKHGATATYLLDIWLLYTGSRQDHRLRPWKRKLKKCLWAWGM